MIRYLWDFKFWKRNENQIYLQYSAERPKQIRPVDNLKQTGEFVIVERDEYIPAERPQQVKPTDNLRPEGEFYSPDKPQFRAGIYHRKVNPSVVKNC